MVPFDVTRRVSSNTEPTGEYPHVTVYLHPDEKIAVRQAAAAEDKSMSDFARSALLDRVSEKYLPDDAD